MNAILALLGITYELFIKTYINKRNPENNMYWSLDAIEVHSGTPYVLLWGYLKRAQACNLEIVLTTGKVATVDELLSAPFLSAVATRKLMVADAERFAAPKKAQAKGAEPVYAVIGLTDAA